MNSATPKERQVPNPLPGFLFPSSDRKTDSRTGRQYQEAQKRAFADATTAKHLLCFLAAMYASFSVLRAAPAAVQTTPVITPKWHRHQHRSVAPVGWGIFPTSEHNERIFDEIEQNT